MCVMKYRGFDICVEFRKGYVLYLDFFVSIRSIRLKISFRVVGILYQNFCLNVRKSFVRSQRFCLSLAERTYLSST